MAGFAPKDLGYERRVRDSFARQSLMTTMGAAMERVEPGLVAIALPFAPHILQQHGLIHGGATTAIADAAAGYAALSLMPAGMGVLTVELKINLMAPAAGERLVATGRVIRPGRTLTICQADVVAEDGGASRRVALLTATMMTIEGRDGVVD